MAVVEELVEVGGGGMRLRWEEMVEKVGGGGGGERWWRRWGEMVEEIVEVFEEV